MEFSQSSRSTLGIEWELQLIDQDSNDLRQAADSVLARIREREGAISSIASEMLLNTIEIISEPHYHVAECVSDLLRGLDMLTPVVAPMRIELTSAGSHPFADPAHQRVTDSQRYAQLVERTRYWGRQMLLFGTHVHVGIDDRRKLFPILRASLTRFAHVQALVASSPYWAGKNTGYADNRAMTFQQLPTAGTPYQFNTWDELMTYYQGMKKTGVISTFDELRWDVRPSPKFGTIEFRMCDAVTNTKEIGMIAALCQCMVEYFSRELDAGHELPTLPDWFVAENKWRASRYGIDTQLIIDADGTEESVEDTIRHMVHMLEPVAQDLGCLDELHMVDTVFALEPPYKRLLRAGLLHGNSREAIVDFMLAETRANRPLDPATHGHEGIAAKDAHTPKAFDMR